MYIIVGLGNPTKEYMHTRHNVGFDTIDAIAEKIPDLRHGKETQGTDRKRLYRRTESDPRKAADLYEFKW